MALKHYKQAYGHCLEAKLNENLILEVKTLAGFITYKVMKPANEIGRAHV